MTESDEHESATFGGGCFWCTEAVLQRLAGVESVVPGYAGGEVENPSYEQVCTGTTGHAEAVHVTFNPQIIPYAKLLEVFFATHDPTTLNRQGADVGPQYRSVIFYHNDEQRQLAGQHKAELDASGTFSDPVVTDIAPFTNFFPAENYHQDYYRRNAWQPYCRAVVDPKLEKLHKSFGDMLKPGN